MIKNQIIFLPRVLHYYAKDVALNDMIELCLVAWDIYAMYPLFLFWNDVKDISTRRCQGSELDAQNIGTFADDTLSLTHLSSRKIAYKCIGYVTMIFR
jgi:hypothetical protein